VPVPCRIVTALGIAVTHAETDASAHARRVSSHRNREPIRCRTPARASRFASAESTIMEPASELAARLTQASRRQLWDVHTHFQWPEQLDEAAWWMPPELISLHGTETWEQLDSDARLRLSRFEIGNFFSLVLQGERPLVQGLIHRIHAKDSTWDVTDYLHHFVDEENKHMVMFGEFCRRYIGKVYPEKKVALSRKYAKGEEDVVFFCKVMVVEEYGDFYNVAIERDERVEPFVREMNRMHHVDEARHLAFGRRYLAEIFDRNAAGWSEETLVGLRTWLAQYLKASWADYYNPAAYKDAGIEDAYAARQAALAHPACAEHRKRASAKLVTYFLKTGLLSEWPAL
jgi:hypothetical protein